MVMIFILQFVNTIYHINLQILNYACIPKISPACSCYMIFSMHCWFQFADILLRIFTFTFISHTVLYFSIFVVSLVLLSGWCWLCRMSSEAFIPLSFFWVVWEGYMLTLLQTFNRKYLWTHPNWCFGFYLCVKLSKWKFLSHVQLSVASWTIRYTA